jgi:hypothetical protein
MDDSDKFDRNWAAGSREIFFKYENYDPIRPPKTTIWTNYAGKLTCKTELFWSSGSWDNFF